jgi:hypothetical protein
MKDGLIDGFGYNTWATRELCAEHLDASGLDELWQRTRCCSERIHQARRLNGRSVEIACDESGYEGERLIGVSTDVFAHAGTRLDVAAAEACMRELRERIRSPAVEYGANHLLREKHRRVLVWLLGPSAPLLGNARVYLIDKAFYVVAGLVRLLAEEDGARAEDMGRALYRAGRRLPGRARWETFLAASNGLLRIRERDQPDAATLIDAFFQALDGLRPAGLAGLEGEILSRLQDAGPRAVALRKELQANPTMIPPLDPLIPAIVRAVASWGEGGQPVSVVHDRHNALSEERVGQLMELIGRPADRPQGAPPGGWLARLSLADSHLDARIQLADILAGVARKFASDELNERGDPELTALVSAYVDPASIWGDERSRSLLMA